MSLERNPRKPRTRPAAPVTATSVAAPTVHGAAPTDASAPALTLEALAYAALFALALATRLRALDVWPLTAAESEQSWAAWLVFRGGRPDAAGLSPLLVYGSALSFVLVGASDAAARLLPALVGSALVLLPGLLRASLGRAASLAAAALILISPSFLAFSRQSDSGILVAAGSLGLLACGIALFRAPSPCWAMGAVISATLLLLGDGSAMLPLLALATGALLLWWAASPVRRSDLVGLLSRTRAWAWLAGLVALLGSGLLTNLGALRWGLVEAPFAWLAGLVQPAADRPWTYYAGALLAYEPLVVLLALIAVGRLAYLHLASMRPGGTPAPSRPDLILFLAGWAALALGVISLGAARPAAGILLALLPLTLLAAWSLGWLGELCWRARLLQTGGVGLAGVLFVILLAGVSIANPVTLFGGRFETLERQLQIVQGVIVLVLGAFLISVGVWLVLRLGWRTGLLSLGAGLVALLAVIGIHSASQLAYYPGETEMLAPEASSIQVRSLVADLTSVTRFTGESATPLQVDPSLAYPLAWYLREYKTVSWTALTTPASAAAVIVPGDGSSSPGELLGAYTGRRYRLATTWQDPISPDASLWGWLANRVPLGPVKDLDVVVYLAAAP